MWHCWSEGALSVSHRQDQPLPRKCTCYQYVQIALCLYAVSKLKIRNIHPLTFICLWVTYQSGSFQLALSWLEFWVAQRRISHLIIWDFGAFNPATDLQLIFKRYNLYKPLFLHETIQFLFSLSVLNIFISNNTKKNMQNAKYLLEYFVLFYHYLVTWIKVTVLSYQGMASGWGTIHVKRLPSCDNVFYVLLVKLTLYPLEINS